MQCAAASVGAPEPSGPLRVVVVDDTPDMRLLLRVQLAADPRFELVGEGADGTEAIELAGRLRPDLMVLDRQMPVLGGIEAIDPIRQVSPGTAIVLYTAATDPDVHHTALAAGALEVLDKAAGADFVEALTSKLLERASAPDASIDVRVGPVDATAARVWIANTTAILDAVANHPEVVTVPPDVLEFFGSLLEQWREVAAAADQFVWVARARPEDVSRIVEHWAVVDAMSDEDLERLGVAWSPPVGQPFFQALTAGVLRAMECHEETRRLAARLSEQWAPH